MTRILLYFRRPYLRASREEAQKAHNAALAAGDTRLQKVTRARLVEITHECLKAGV